MKNRSLAGIHFSGAALAAACLIATPGAVGQQSPNPATGATTNLGTMVVAPSQAPASSTVAGKRLRVQRRTLDLNLGSGPSPIAPTAPPGKSRHIVEREPPLPLHLPPPEYPAAALANRTRGTVTVAFTILTDGSTSGIHITSSQPEGVFNQAAIAAVKQWRFRPATADGTPVPTNVSQTLVFRPPARKEPEVAKQPPSPAKGGQPPPNSVPSNIHPTHLVPPDYPPNAYRSRQGGHVTVSFMVMPNGHTRDIRVLASKPRHTFDHAAVEAVRQWQFKPVKAPTRVVQTISFTPPE